MSEVIDRIDQTRELLLAALAIIVVPATGWFARQVAPIPGHSAMRAGANWWSRPAGSSRMKSDTTRSSARLSNAAIVVFASRPQTACCC